MIQSPHSITIKEVTAKLACDADRGLSSSEIKNRRRKYGRNILKSTSTRSTWSILLDQFLDPIIYVLGIAMILGFAFEEWLEGFAVLAVILITVSIGFFMELQAVRSIESLRKLAQISINVLRNGKIFKIKSPFIVPGDIILLAPGDVIPVDARLIWHQSLGVKEAMLTGESDQVEKDTKVLPIDTPLAEQTNMVFKGTIVLRGNAKAIVSATGNETQVGQISSLTREAEKSRNPLEKRLNSLSRWLIGLTLILAAIIVISGYIQGKDLSLMIKTGIALAIATIPEGLPIVATIALARGMIKLSKQKVIIKKLEAVQTLGETTVICTDKTGTLTENKMSVHELLLDNHRIKYEDLMDASFAKQLEKNRAFTKLMEAGILCNNVQPDVTGLNGDSLEIALIEFAQMSDVDIAMLRKQYMELEEIPFDAERKMMVTLNQHENEYAVYAKGAAESILDVCDYIIAKEGNVKSLMDKQKWLDLADEVASEGLRVLAFAFKDLEKRPATDEFTDKLIFTGLIGFLDPPRKDVKQAIQTYRDAGIKVVMITGDHPRTARKIAEEIGLLTSGDPAEKVIHGQTILDLESTIPENNASILNASVFARMIPKQKLDLVKFYQNHNAVVGMIGDGVNDAPALKRADIGIATGIRGTEAAKEVADVILLDDQFTSTELAIRQGRNIFGNIRQFVVYLLSCNLAEIIAVTVASLSNLPLPLLPLQILFLNLVTDVFPALALGMGKGNTDIMKLPPRDPDEPIMTVNHWIITFVYGIGITASVMAITIYAHYQLRLPSEVVNNMAFYTLILAQLLNVFNIPGRDRSFFKNEVTQNLWIWAALLLSAGIMFIAYTIPLTNRVLSLVDLSTDQFLLIGLFGLGSLVLIQIMKRLIVITKK
ncbi:MAG: cation-transporting P-type ATPase [Flavobacteriaceae bacterium]|nr:cation-transporting P-type ATPase [Flavobacteriaceae bacterium]NNJ80591.1 cation-transporting P-type ATPase [Flavobacteriaceae bacterium]